MRILIVSDTHRNNENFLKVMDREAPFDMVIHCGDTEGSEYLISRSAGCPTHIVMGNNDFFSDLPREDEFMIAGRKVWVTHGHNYYVSLGNETIKEIARQRGMDIVMYGHTHRPLIEEESDLTIINPGSLTYPRQNGHRPSYVIMEVDAKNDLHYSLHYL